MSQLSGGEPECEPEERLGGLGPGRLFPVGYPGARDPKAAQRERGEPVWGEVPSPRGGHGPHVDASVMSSPLSLESARPGCPWV